MTFYMLDLRLRNIKCEITVHMCTMKKKLNSQAWVEKIKALGVRNVNKQEQGVSVGQPIPIWAHARNPIADGAL